MASVSVIGAGAWGTALACVARRAGHETVLWAREPEVVAAIDADRVNTLFLPGVDLDDGISPTSDLAGTSGADVVLLAVPAQFLRGVAEELHRIAAPDAPFVVCAKGIEQQTGATMSKVVAAAAPGRPFAILSGPTFAIEVARGAPTAVTIASGALSDAASLAEMLGSAAFRPYASDDVVGAELGGAVKNVLAIACGITEGRGLGENARAALITRGLAEITRLCVARGGRAETMMGLSGLGDIALTCASRKSRNYSVGVALGEGAALQDFLSGKTSVAEGVFTASAAVAMAEKLDVDMPIATAVDAILNRGADIDQVIVALLARPLRAEG